MQLKNNNTKWVLFLGSESESENRHIFDLVFGVYALESAGIQPQDVEIYIDGANRANIEVLFSMGTINRYNIRPSQDFFTSVAENSHRNMVLFVTGHGSPFGIVAPQTITPFKLLSRIKNTPGLERAVVFLGQCFAGIFNYIGAGRGFGSKEPDVVFIGATSLHPSISRGTSELMRQGNSVPWVANVFLLFVFKWFQSPVDVDGDSKFSIMDCYKFAGSWANIFNKVRQNSNFDSLIEARERYIQSDASHKAHVAQSPGIDPMHATKAQFLAFSLDTHKKAYILEREIYHTHQECWILNSIPAQQIEFG